jgi:hypothetical protein
MAELQRARDFLHHVMHGDVSVVLNDFTLRLGVFELFQDMYWWLVLGGLLGDWEPLLKIAESRSRSGGLG